MTYRVRPEDVEWNIPGEEWRPGQPVRHTTVIEATPTRLTDGRTRWRGKRCDGTSIEWVEP